jgi:hypothetical protein
MAIFVSAGDITDIKTTTTISYVCSSYKTMVYYVLEPSGEQFLNKSSGKMQDILKEVPYKQQICQATEQMVTIDKTILYPSRKHMKCSENRDYVICDSSLDGNGDGICQSGESCNKILKNNATLTTTGYLSKTSKDSITYDFLSVKK